MTTFRIAITGSSGLADAIIRAISDKKIGQKKYKVISIRIDERVQFSDFDCFINLAHVNFEQVNLFFSFFEKWKFDEHKFIINISSRAAQPNISKGYLYAAQKAALNHIANNVTYNSEKQCRISTINLGLLEHELPSLKHMEIAELVKMLLSLPEHIEISDVTMQHKANYMSIQKQKEQLIKNQE